MNWNPRTLQTWMFLLVIPLAVVWVMNSTRPVPPETIRYSQFLQAVDKGQVAAVKVAGPELQGSFSGGGSFRTYLPPDADVSALLAEKGVEQEYLPPVTTPWPLQLLGGLLPPLLFLGLFFYLSRRGGGGLGPLANVGRSTARLNDPKRGQPVTFADVAGVDEAKTELQEVVDFLKDPGKYHRMGARIPKGVMLYGPPGTGKTLLARAVAGEAGVPFFNLSGSEFVEMFVGVGASRVRDLFAKAKAVSPAIVFIDEMDAVGRQRGAGPVMGGHDEREQTLNQLLVEMDGFDPAQGLVVIAATNRIDVLDPALLRPGRFDRHIAVDPPDVRGREAILQIHAKGKPLAPDVQLAVVAKRTPGTTGADLENLMNEAALLAARSGKAQISMVELDQAVDRVVVGGPEKKSRVISAEQKRLVAVHEAGHTLVAHLQPEHHPVHKVTIIPRGGAGGYTAYLPADDRMVHSRRFLLANLATLLAGRAAEQLVLGDVSTGAHSDLERATALARKMVAEFGMSEELGAVGLGSPGGNPFFGRERTYSEETASRVDRAVEHLLAESAGRAEAMLTEHRELLLHLTAVLIDRETLDADELKEILPPRPVSAA